MPFFLHQWTYKDQQVRSLLLESTDRSEVVRVAIEAFGGTLQSFYYCFGSYDGLAISKFPDHETALAAVLAITGQGRINALQTTVLLSAEEGLKAMRQASDAIKDRQAPGAP